jgi:hypothetical protein
MTLVLSALTQHEIIQVSDRRFTYTRPDGSIVSQNDEKNKAVLFCGRLMLSFTGRGDLGKDRRTDLWLAERICEVLAETDSGDQAVLLRGLAARATALFRRAYGGQRHAFVAAGWARFVDQPTSETAKPHEFRPYLACISNFHGPDGHELDAVSDAFSIWLRVLQSGEGGFVWDAPHHLSRSETDRLAAELSAADGARSVKSLAGSLADQILAVADRDSGVGRGLMINVLPRKALGQVPGIMAVAGGPMADSQTFLYVPPSGDTTIQLGPVTTCGGGITSGFRAEPLPGDWESPPMPASLPDDPPNLIRRWYLVPVVGTGTTDDPFRAETLGRGGSAVIPSRDDGHPKHGVALVLISTTEHAELEADPRIHPLGDMSDLDLPVGELPDTKRAWLESVVRDRGVPATGLVRDVIRLLGRQLDPEFDEREFWAR